MRLLLIRPPVVHLRADFYGSIPGIPSGLCYLAAAVREQGVEVDLLDCYGEDPHRFYRFRRRWRARGLRPEEAARRMDPEVTAVGISVHCAAEHTMSATIAREIKALHPELPVIVGGYHATFLPEEFVEAGADYVVMGEGESRLPRLLRALESGEDPSGQEGVAGRGFCNRRESKYTVDLDSMPFAAVDLVDLQAYWKLGYGHGPVREPYMNILTSRGCPYDCAFCQAPGMCGRRWLAKSPGRVLEEVRYHMDAYGVRDFHIQDENFGVDRERAEEICRLLAELDPPVTFCFPSGVKMETLDESMLELLAAAGCRYISMSPETGSRRVLELMNKTANIELVPRLVRRARSLGIRTCTFFVAGYPGETESDRRETRAYVRRLARAGVDEMVMPVLTPFPATASMEEPSLQGWTEIDELCFSPVWRSDYRSLDRYRLVTYLHFYAVKLLHHPLAALRQLWNVFTGRSETKGEMTARRLPRDLLDSLMSALRR